MDGKGFVDAIVDKVAPKEKDEDTGVAGIDLSPRELDAAADVLDVIDPYGMPSEPGEPSKDETPLQRQQREIDRRASEERRRAKAEVLGKTLKAFFMLVDSGPHEEGEHQDEGGGDEE